MCLECILRNVSEVLLDAALHTNNRAELLVIMDIFAFIAAIY